MVRLSCLECRQCNRKGKPSVTRLSIYCDKHHVNRVREKVGLFSKLVSFKDRLLKKDLMKKQRV